MHTHAYTHLEGLDVTVCDEDMVLELMSVRCSSGVLKICILSPLAHTCTHIATCAHIHAHTPGSCDIIMIGKVYTVS